MTKPNKPSTPFARHPLNLVTVTRRRPAGRPPLLFIPHPVYVILNDGDCGLLPHADKESWCVRSTPSFLEASFTA